MVYYNGTNILDTLNAINSFVNHDIVYNTCDAYVGVGTACEPNEFECDSKKCILKTWRCDSDDDCGDGSDER